MTTPDQAPDSIEFARTYPVIRSFEADFDLLLRVNNECGELNAPNVLAWATAQGFSEVQAGQLLAAFGDLDVNLPVYEYPLNPDLIHSGENIDQ